LLPANGAQKVIPASGIACQLIEVEKRRVKGFGSRSRP
jgi:hypothetical protein